MTATAERTTSAGISSPVIQLKAACAFTFGFGIMIVLGSHAATDGPLRLFLDLLFWPLGDRAELTDEGHLLAAILGGVMSSWAIVIWLLTDALADEQPALVQRIIMITIGSWFVIDTAGSLAAGAWMNAILNTAFMLLFVVPARRLA